jgi:excisionase family DNA binding protein
MTDKMRERLEAEPEVMDARDAALYLGIGMDALYQYAAEKTIPAFKMGNRWKFRRKLLDAWMNSQSGVSIDKEGKLR